MLNYETMEDEETYIPEHMRSGYRFWIEHGIKPGSFGEAIINNDPAGAAGRADHINALSVQTQIAWFEKYAPKDCWNQSDVMETWKGEI